jgi:hypothetical protein
MYKNAGVPTSSELWAPGGWAGQLAGGRNFIADYKCAQVFLARAKDYHFCF